MATNFGSTALRGALWTTAAAAAVAYGFSALHRQLGSGQDLPLILEASRALRAGGSPCDVASGLHGYVYLPFLALVLTPLELLPRPAAIGIVYAGNLALSALAFFWTASLLTRSRFPGATPTSARVAAAISLAVHFRFFLANYDMGQVNLVILVLLLGAARLATDSDRDARAGFLIGLAAAIKPHALLVAVPFAFQRRWRGVGGAAAGLIAAGVLLPALWLGPAQTAERLGEWHRKVVAPSVVGSLQGSRIFDQSPQAAVRRLVLPDPAFSETRVNLVDLGLDGAKALVLGLQAGFGLMLLGAWWTARRADPASFVLDLALAMTGMLLVFGYALQAQFAVLLLPGALIAAWMLTQAPRGARRLALAAALCIVASVPGLVGREAANFALAYSSVTLGLVIEFALLLWMRVK